MNIETIASVLDACARIETVAERLMIPGVDLEFAGRELVREAKEITDAAATIHGGIRELLRKNQELSAIVGSVHASDGDEHGQYGDLR